MNNLIYKYLTINVLTVFLSMVSYGQFTYVSLNAGYEGVSFTREIGTTITGIRSFAPSISFVSRFKRHVGIGGQFSLALAQNSKFSFDKANTSSTTSFADFYITDPSDRYYAEVYDYSFEYKNYSSIFLRFFFDRVVNSYMDIQLSYTNISESFMFERQYVPETYQTFGGVDRPSIPKEEIDFNQEKRIFSPGFKFGISPLLTEDLFLDFNFGFDFMFIDSEGFSYSVPFKYDHNGWHEYVNFESQMVGTKTMFSIRLGIGHYF